MRLLIDIPDEQYEYIKKSDKNTFAAVSSKECMLYAIKNGIPISTDNDLNGEWAKGFHEGFNAGNMLAEAFSEDTPYKDAYNKTLEEMKKECRSMTKPMEYLYYGECLGTFEQTFNKHLREAGNETDN